MSVERRWEKPFDKLIEQLNIQYGKGAAEPTVPGVSAPKPASGCVWTYPVFAGGRGEDKVFVTVSETPVGIGTFLDAADNYEFLQLSLCRPLKTKLTLRHEGFFDRLKKSIKFEWEYQTGHEKFDRKYFILDAIAEGDRKLVSNREFQALIEQAEPFASLALWKSGVHLSSALAEGDELSLGRIEERLARLEVLANFAEKQYI